ncbi:FAD-dependent monooxygenase [Cryptosporangium arvum]|uniref:FAD-dependent monooxygenase n=1 Tax=Cryptosporangium arvum TaxID=80871 RepID=UPI0004BA90F7|nr:FAD-dependent monooxygenase [Cryptosporangium arvum]
MRIVVVGGGIAGLATARALGVPCVVLEQGSPPSGYGLQLGPAAVRLLERWGVDLSFAVRPAFRELRRWDSGALIARTPLEAPYAAMRRADLHRALGAGVPVRRARCVGVSDAVHLSSGRSVPADLVVGADGLRSVVRRAVAADEVRTSGVFARRVLVRAPWPDPPRVRVWLGPGQHCVSYPIAPGVLNVVAVGSSFDAWHADVRELLARGRAPVRHELCDRAPLPRRVAGRVALVGDAAHPMLPYLAQGASQALLDADALASCLAAAPSIDAALARYDAERTPRATALAEAVRRAGIDNHLPDGPEQRARDQRLAAGGDR